jgi:hypothetical protein
MLLRIKPNLNFEIVERFRQSLKACCEGDPIFITDNGPDRDYSIQMREGLTDERWNEMLLGMDECIENEHKPMLELRWD